MKKFLCLFLSVLMLAPAMISCQNTEQPDDTSADSVSDSVSDSETETTAPEEAKPDLPDVTYDGATYSILAAAEQFIKKYYVESEEIEGDIEKQAVYDRNTAIEGQYDVALDYIVFNGYTAGIPVVGTALLDAISGSATYDLVVGMASYVTPHIVSGYFADLNLPEFHYIDSTAPWYYKYINENLEINGSLYLASGSYGMNALSGALVTFFNKQLIEDNNLEDMYKLVREKKWTFDKMMEMADKAKRDVNGDDTFTRDEDVFGVTTVYDYAGFLPNAFDYTYFSRDESNTVVLTGVTDKLIDINEKMYKFSHTDYCFSGTSNQRAAEMRNLFVNNQALFMLHTLLQASNGDMRKMGDYGIVPAPLYDSEQDHYIAPTIPDVLGVPSYVEDIDFSCIIAEALTYESWKTVNPAYLEGALKEKYSRDPDTAEMVDLVISNATTDFCYLYLRLIGIDLLYQTGKEEQYASWAASNHPIYETKLADLLKSINDQKKAQGQ